MNLKNCIIYIIKMCTCMIWQTDSAERVIKVFPQKRGMDEVVAFHIRDKVKGMFGRLL